jgi:DNA-binding NtrC family response regulator
LNGRLIAYAQKEFRLSRITNLSRKPFILIADSSPSILNLFEATLELNNFTVLTANSARQCISIFSCIKDSIDIVLTDGLIAGDQGIEVIMNIHRLKPDRKILVIVEEESAKAKAMRVGGRIRS